MAFAWAVTTLWRVFAGYGASVGTCAAVAGALVGRTVASALRLCRIPFGGLADETLVGNAGPVCGALNRGQQLAGEAHVDSRLLGRELEARGLHAARRARSTAPGVRGLHLPRGRLRHLPPFCRIVSGLPPKGTVLTEEVVELDTRAEKEP